MVWIELLVGLTVACMFVGFFETVCKTFLESRPSKPPPPKKTEPLSSQDKKILISAVVIVLLAGCLVLIGQYGKF